MKKIIAVALISLGFAGSALAQAAADDSWSRGQQPYENGMAADPAYVDTMTTQSIGAPNDGTGGSSSADTNEFCPPGTPGAGNNSTPIGTQKLNPACNN